MAGFKDQVFPGTLAGAGVGVGPESFAWDSAEQASMVAEAEPGKLEMLAAAVCGLAIASVPIFSTDESLSIIPQAIAALAVGFGMLTLLKRIPRIHLCLWAYVMLVICLSLTLLSEPEVWANFQTLAKVCLLALTAHLVFRRPKQLLLLFGIYSATGAVTVGLNWEQLQALGASLSGARNLTESDRFAGTFANANTAGIYGVVLMLSALVLLFNSRWRWRWVLVVTGLAAGLTICFFSGSRKAMLGMAFLLFMVPWMAEPSARTGRRNLLRAMAILVPMAGAGVLLFSHLPFMERLLVPFTQGLTAESSSETRMAMLLRVFELWGTHPVFGCGFDGFSRLSEFGVYSHTTFGEILCDGGLVGLALAGVFYLVPPVQLAHLTLRGVSIGPTRLPIALFSFWGVFAIFSLFAVLFDSREYIPICAAVCGYIQEIRGLRAEVRTT